jgi:glycosyltransferase involved in cell wall biosynthesis
VPVVHTYHALGVVKRRHHADPGTSQEARIDVEGQLSHRADRIVATCSDEVFELRQLGASVPISVVPCGVDPGLFRPEGPREPRPPGGPRHRVLVVGRLVERKGVADVIRAMVEVPDAELVVAGGPAPAQLRGDPEVVRLRAAAAEAGVADRVVLRGRVERAELPALLRSADVVVCAPWYEPFGIVPLEAMATGVPVVVSAVGGLVDSVVDGITGLHVPARDPRSLGAAVRELLAAPRRRAAMGAAGVARARTRYSWARVAESTAEVYEDVLAAVPAPAGARGGSRSGGRAGARVVARPAARSGAPTGTDGMGSTAPAVVR